MASIVLLPFGRRGLGASVNSSKQLTYSRKAALLTRTSSLPNSLTVLFTAVHAEVGVSHIAGD